MSRHIIMTMMTMMTMMMMMMMMAGHSKLSRSLACPCQVFDAKRLIGRKFADPIVQADIKLWPFKCVAGQGDKPMIIVNAQGEAGQIEAWILYPFYIRISILIYCIHI